MCQKKRLRRDKMGGVAGKSEEIFGLDTPGVARGYLSFAPPGLGFGGTTSSIFSGANQRAQSENNVVGSFGRHGWPWF